MERTNARWILLIVVVLSLLSPRIASSHEDGEFITATGELSIVRMDDFEGGTSQTRYELHPREGGHHHYELEFLGEQPRGLRSGMPATVRGEKRAHKIILRMGEEGGGSIQTGSPQPMAVAGDQKTIVMIVNFLDATVGGTVADVNGIMFTNAGSVDAFYRETSFNQLSFSGDVVGPYTINYYKSSTSFDAWGVAADAAATAAGVNLSLYTRRLYVMPANGTGYGGVAYLAPPPPSKAWTFYWNYPDIYAHELGHSLGMHHASTPGSEYGDDSDTMGIAYQRKLLQVNGPHKVEMEWIPPSQVQTVTANGTYSVRYLEDATLEAQVLKIAKPDTLDNYYISYRRPVGFDAYLRPEHVDRVFVHTWKAKGYQTVRHAVLGDGQEYKDFANAIAITAVSHTSTHATLNIQFNFSPVLTPTVTISPTGVTTLPGETRTFTVSVRNNDAASQSATTFAFSSTVLRSGTAQTGWTTPFSPAALSLAPGTTGTSTLTVTSPSNAPDAYYALSANVSDGVEPLHSASATVNYYIWVRPTVTITSPVAGSIVTGLVPVDITAVDNEGIVRQVLLRVYQNGVYTSAGTDTTAPYSVLWNSTQFQNGSATLYAYALDNIGYGISSAHVVTISNSGTIDTSPPSCSITSPANNSGGGGTITFAADAADNVGVTRVEFYRASGTVLLGTDTTAPYSIAWDTTTVPNGGQLLSAKAFDAAGNVGDSGMIAFNVNNSTSDTTAPTCSITSPVNGSTVSGTVTFAASASDNVGVTRVDFFRDGVSIGSDMTAPYSVSWNTTTASNGSHSLTARAYDAAGNVGNSSAISVTVSNNNGDTTGPIMAFLSPANGATVSGKVPLNVSATDVSGVARVEFYVNGTLRYTDSTAAYSWSWNSRSLRGQSVVLMARGYDAFGNQTSISITVTVAP